MTDKRRRSKVNVKNLLQNSLYLVVFFFGESICCMFAEELKTLRLIIDQETQNRTWLPYFTCNWNYVNIYLDYQYDISVIVARMSLPWNFHSNKEHVRWLYSQAMVRFYTVGVRRKGTCFRGLVIITCDGGGDFGFGMSGWALFFCVLRPEKANACLLWPEKDEKVMPDCCAG